jgi:hypothetical protein
MPNITLKYVPPGGAATTKTFNALAIKGVGFPDAFENFPGVQHKLLDGSIVGYTKGQRRLITIELPIIQDIADAKAILYFLRDDDREIVTTMTAPANPGAFAEAGGSLPDDTYYYKVSAIDEAGESIASSEVQATTSGTDNSVTVDWDTVSGAVRYKIYRSLVTGTYGTVSFLVYVNAGTLSYTDTGAVTLTPGTPLADADIGVALANPSSFENEWVDGIEIGRHYVLQLQENVVWDGFPA